MFIFRQTGIYSVFLLVLIHISCKPEQESHIAGEADSLIQLTLDLQKAISSPGIHRLSEFRDEIIRDLELVETRHPKMAMEEAGQEASAIDLYMKLNLDLEHCLQACSQFHEEAYMLETTLSEIKGHLGQKGADEEILQDMIAREWMVYSDLATRIDSSIRNVELHSQVYYSLKPTIDSLLLHKGNQPLP